MVLCTFISPFKSDRAVVRGLFPTGRFIEIHVQCDLEECRRRDPHGLYQKAFSGEIKNFTGLSSPYESPENPELLLDTQTFSLEECVDQVEEYLRTHFILTRQKF